MRKMHEHAMCILNQKIKPTGLQDGSSVHINSMHIKSSRQLLPSKRSRTFKDSPIDREGCFWCPMQARNTTYSTPTICIPTSTKMSSDVIRCQTTIVVLPRSWQHFAAASLFAHACLRSTAVSMAKRPRALGARVICTGLPN